MEQEITAVQKAINTAIEFCIQYSFQVVGAIIVLIIGFMIANSISRILLAFFDKKKLDITFSKFIAGCVRVVILAFAVLIALGKFGITIAPFIAAFSALAFGASFAIQGPLSNYGAGLSIILSRPFVVGDTITVAGVSGVVKDVKLACTTLTDEDGIKITIPNRQIVGEILHNSHANKIVEAVIGISYDSNPETAVRAVESVLAKFSEVTREPKPQVGIEAFADSSINIGYRYWIPTAKYYQTLYAINLAIFKAFESQGIKIPFPRRDVHIVSQTSTISS